MIFKNGMDLKMKRAMPKERMLIGFDDNGTGYIMCRRGPGIDGEDVGTSAEDLGISVPDERAEGLWVYDVVPTFCEDHCEGYGTGYGNLEYDDGTWRRPTPDEWHCIQNGNMEGLRLIWSDVPSQQEWGELLKKDEQEAVSKGEVAVFDTETLSPLAKQEKVAVKLMGNLQQRMEKAMKDVGAVEVARLYDEVIYEVPAESADKIREALKAEISSTLLEPMPTIELPWDKKKGGP